MRRRIVGQSVLFLLVIGITLLCEKVSQEKSGQEPIVFPIIIKDSILRAKMPEVSLNSGMEMPESKESESQEDEEERSFEETELVEMIANPMLMKDAMLEDFIPFVSYAEAMDLEGQEYAYMPRAELTDPEEIKSWGGEMLYDLVLHPEKVEEYGAILTLTSVKAWKSFQWIYANPEDYYCHVYNDAERGDQGEYVHVLTYVGVPYEYFYGDLHRLNALDRTYAEGVSRELFDFIWGDRDIGIKIAWSYERKTGLIQIKGMDYRKLGGG